jgi:hypothetical protein
LVYQKIDKMADTAAVTMVAMSDGADTYPALKTVLESVQTKHPVDVGDANNAVTEFNALVARVSGQTDSPTSYGAIPTISVDSPVLLRRPSATDQATIQRLQGEVHELQLR